MPEISFALIDSKFLNRKELKIKQIESVIEVSGDLDPLQLQRIRDRAGPAFEFRKKQIADLIVATHKQLQTEKDPKKRDALTKNCVTEMDKASKVFDKKVQKLVTDFCAADEKMMAAGSGNWTFAVSTLWSLGTIVAGGVEIGESLGKAAMGNVLELPKLLKGILDAALEIEGLSKSINTWWRSLEQQEKELESKLAELKKVKKGAPVPQSAIDKAEVAQQAFGPKIDSLEKETRAMAAKLDKLLKMAGSIPNAKAQTDAEKTIDGMITSIIDLTGNLAKKRDAQKKAADTIRTARTKAKNDTWYWVEWAKAAYELYNNVMDVAGIAGDLSDAAKGLVASIKLELQAAEKEAELVG